MAVVIRPAVAADGAAIRALVRSTPRMNPTGLDWPNFVVAELEGAIVGVAQLRPAGAGAVELGSLVVRPDRRRQGLAGRLVGAALVRATGRVLIVTGAASAHRYAPWGFARIAPRRSGAVAARARGGGAGGAGAGVGPGVGGAGGGAAGGVSRSWVALLHTVVLGPGRRVVMADLRALAADLGFAEPRTLLATGNLIFRAEAADAAAVEARLEPAFAAAFGKAVTIIVREGADWPGLLSSNPFRREAESDPAHVVARVMRAPLDAAAPERFEAYLSGDEALAVVGGDLWGYFPHGIGTSKLAAALTPARTGGAGTFRNWNTIRRIGEALDGR